MTSSDTQRGPVTEFAAGVIDVNAVIGPDVPAERSTGATDVQATQRRFGIGQSLVRSSTAVRLSRELGNRSVLELAGTPGLSPAVVASAPRLDNLAGELAAAARAGARAVWVEYDHWERRTETARRLLQVAAGADLPLLVPHRQPGDASALGELTAANPVPLVLVEARYPDFAEVVPALERYANLHIETSGLGSFDAVDGMVRVVGHERVLFGSGTPVHTPLSPLYALLQADLSADARRAILAGNAARLFGLAPPAPSTLRMTIPERLYDVHGHFFPAPWPVPDQPGTSILGDLARYGIRTQVASSIPAIMGDLEFGNRQTVDACRDHPGQLGYLVAHPADPGLARAHLERWGDAPGIVGVKVHAELTGIPTRSARMAELFEVLAGYGRPVKIHNHGDGWPEALLALARRHPRLPIVVAHSGIHRPQPASAAVVNGTDNVHLELASSKADIRDARDLVGAVPAERVLFGSDAPLINPAFVLGLYQDVGLEQPVLDRVYWDNGERLFAAWT